MTWALEILLSPDSREHLDVFLRYRYIHCRPPNLHKMNTKINKVNILFPLYIKIHKVNILFTLYIKIYGWMETDIPNTGLPTFHCWSKLAGAEAALNWKPCNLWMWSWAWANAFHFFTVEVSPWVEMTCRRTVFMTAIRFRVFIIPFKHALSPLLDLPFSSWDRNTVHYALTRQRRYPSKDYLWLKYP